MCTKGPSTGVTANYLFPMTTDGGAVDKLLREVNAGLREHIDQLQEDKRRLQEELANAHTAIDKLKENVEKLHERHDEELRELAEEMKAGWAFSVVERDSENERLTAEVQRLGEESTVRRRLNDELFERLFSFLVSEEVYARAVIESEEESVVLPLTLAEVRRKCLPIHRNDDEAIGNALYRLYECAKSGDISEAVVRELLKEEVDLTRVYFNTEGGSECYRDAFTLPRGDILPFLHSVVCQLPAIKSIHLKSLPSLGECVVPLTDSLPRTVEKLGVRGTPYTVADLLKISRSCQSLTKLFVSSNSCSDWGEFAGVEDEETRKRAIDSSCRYIIRWC